MTDMIRVEGSYFRVDHISIITPYQVLADDQKTHVMGSCIVFENGRNQYSRLSPEEIFELIKWNKD